MKIRSNLKKLDFLTDDDIAKAIARDPDAAPDMTTVNFPRARGPQILPTKTLVTIRLSDQVIDHFKKGGKGWQTRLNEFLLAYIREK